MKEIIYIQAGNVSNHIAAHFWNTQENYFTYDDEDLNSREGQEITGSSGRGGGESLVEHDISFREGVSSGRKAETTYCPRVLIFDHKSNFGALGKYNELYADRDDDEGVDADAMWSGPVNEHRQPPIPRSEYLIRLDEGEEDDLDSVSDSEQERGYESYNNSVTKSRSAQRRDKPKHLTSSKQHDFSPQYWTDYNRMFFIPRSTHALPDAWMDYGTSEDERRTYGFGRGAALFRRYEQEHSLMEDDFRRFVEECDHLQGFHISFDAHAHSPFSGFTSAMLESIRDEFAKTAILGIPVGAGSGREVKSRSELDDNALSRIMHDISTSLALEEYASGVVPLLDPSEAWVDKENLVGGVEFDTKSTYHTSSILSAHLESVTLPIRVKYSPLTLSSLLAQLNWSQNDKCASLAGLTGYAGGSETIPLYDFSDGLETFPQIIAQHLVPRGLSPKSAAAYAEQEGQYFTSYPLPAYPVLSSSPRFLRRLARKTLLRSTGNTTSSSKHSSLPAPKSTQNPNPAHSLPLSLLSSLHTSPLTAASRFASYAKLLDTSLREGTWRDLYHFGSGYSAVGVDDAGGIGGSGNGDGEEGGKDELKEVMDRLWKVAEGCGWEYGDGDADGGEDMEVEVDMA